jgi:hypothetical protein
MLKMFVCFPLYEFVFKIINENLLKYCLNVPLCPA